MTQAFNLSQLANKVNSSGQLDVATGVTGTQAVANGGTGQTTYTNGQLLIGNTTGNTLTKSTLTAGAGITITNGAGAITIASATAQVQSELFVGPGTWSCPSTTTQVKVTVIGGGGGTNGGTSGGTSSFGPAVSSTGGSSAGTLGTGTVAVGTALKTGAITGIQESVGTPAQINSQFISFGSFYGRAINNSYVGAAGPSPGVAYSTSSVVMAGAGGGRPATIPNVGGGGGLAEAIVPVSAPVTITVGAGGTAGPALPGNHRPGVGGAVLVEWVS